MDVLKKELEEAFGRQHFDHSLLRRQDVEECRALIRSLTAVRHCCAVLSDLADGRSYFSIGSLAEYLGLDAETASQEVIDSLDEDCIYRRIHPEDLVEKRILELQFFLFLLSLPMAERTLYCSTCRIRMLDRHGDYRYISNRTSILRHSPDGQMQLALCQYELSPEQQPAYGIEARIINLRTGEIRTLCLQGEREHILSPREKEILQLVHQGLLSKEIADRLNISIHTVNRHRQNILEKLSVGNTMEAVSCALKMKLI